MDKDPSRSAELETAAEQLFAERDHAVADELQKVGIAVPPDSAEVLALRPLQLAAGRRAEEVLSLVRREPQRRTVTGSFRTH